MTTLLYDYSSALLYFANHTHFLYCRLFRRDTWIFWG